MSGLSDAGNFDAFQAPITAQWAAGSSPIGTNITMQTAGFDSVAVTITSPATITGGSLTFNVWDGAAWFPVKCARLSSYNTDSTYTIPTLSAANQGWTVPCAGYPQFQIIVASPIIGTGTVTVNAIVSSAPDVSIVTAGLDPQASNPVTTTANNPSFIYSNQWGALPNFTFTVSGVTVQPNLGATYANNGQTFTVLATNAGIVVCSATGYPQTSGTLTRLTGTGDATITFSAYTLLGSQLPFQALVNGIVITALPSNAGTAYIGPPGVTTQSTGYPLFPGQSISYACTNLNLIYAIISVVGDKLAFTGN